MVENEYFTIVLPTRGRHSFLKRTLDFLMKEKCPYTIIVADSSNTDFDYTNYKNYINIYYFNFPAEIKFSHRVSDCLEKVKTPFVMLLGDDDFVNLSVIPKICNFLESNKDYVAADGREIRVRCNQKEIVKNIFHSQPILDKGDCISRISDHCNLYWPTFYSIHRTFVLINSFEVMDRVESLGDLFLEFAASIATIMQGKYYTVSDLYLIRQNFHVQSTAITWWADLIQSPTFKQKNQIMINELMSLGEKLGILFDESNKKKLANAIDNFYSQFQRQNKKNSLKKYIKMLLPKPFQNFIKAVRNQHFPIKEEKLTTIEEAYLSTDFYKKVKEILSIHLFGCQN